MPTRSEVLRARRKAVGGRRPRCRKGKSCSAACINRNKDCLVEAPTPVAGALPRAVRAIQSRRERLKPREKREVLQKRREYVKGKVKEGVEARNRRDKFLKVRGTLLQQIDKAALEEDKYRFTSLMSRLQRLEDGAGSKLGVSRAKVDDYLTLRDRLQRRRKKFENGMYDLIGSMKVASDKGDRNKYNKLESRLLKIKEKTENGLFWKDFFKYRGPIEKGIIWKQGSREREVRRHNKFRSAYNRLIQQAQRAASNNNRGEYNRLEKAILKIQTSASRKNFLNGGEGIKKGGIWEVERLASKAPKILERFDGLMRASLEAGDYYRYKNLEKKLLEIRDKLERGDRLQSSPELRAFRKNSLINDYVGSLRDRMRRAAADGDRREYNKLEQRLLKLTPGSTKGKIWAQQRVNGALDKLKGELEKAIRDNDRERYDKLEERLFRIRNKVGASAIRDSDLRTMTKGKMWNDARGDEAMGELRSSLNKGAREGVSGIIVKGDIGSQFYVTSSVLGNRLDISVSPNNSTSFTVNGSYTASDTLSRREQVAIIRESRRQYDEIFKSMPDGTVFTVTAAEGDDRKGMRERGYTDRGFSAPDANGKMFGKIIRGEVVPIDEDEYDASWKAARGY